MDIAVNIVVGSCLRKQRKDRKLTQRQVAESMGKTQSFVSKTETGERELSAAELFDFVVALGADYTIVAEEIRLGLVRTGYLSE